MTYTFPSIQDDRPQPWRPEDLTALVCQNQFMSPDDWRPVTFVAVLLGESGGNTLINGKTIWKPGHPSHLSVDGGVAQLNSYYNCETESFPGVVPMADVDRFAPFKSMDRSWILLTENGTRKAWSYQMQWWHVYTSGAYEKHTSAALAGMSSYRATMGMGPGPFG